MLLRATDEPAPPGRNIIAQHAAEGGMLGTVAKRFASRRDGIRRCARVPALERLASRSVRLNKASRFGAFMGGFNLQEMLAQARQQAEKLQEKMQQIVVEASSGGGSVTVKMNGQKHVLSVVIEPEVGKTGDV